MVSKLVIRHGAQCIVCNAFYQTSTIERALSHLPTVAYAVRLFCCFIIFAKSMAVLLSYNTFPVGHTTITEFDAFLIHIVLKMIMWTIFGLRFFLANIFVTKDGKHYSATSDEAFSTQTI